MRSRTQFVRRGLAWIGVLALAGLVWVIASSNDHDLVLPWMLGYVVASYVAGALVLLSTHSVIELLIMIGVCVAVLLGLLFAGSEHLGHGAQMLLWALLCGSAYAPVLSFSMAQLFAIEQKE